MENTVTEKTYPIENIWILKLLTPAIFAVLMFGTIFGVFSYLEGTSFNESGIPNLSIYFIILALTVVSQILHKFTFHYSLNDKFIELHQGLLSRQVRHIPYGVIQNVYMKQDIIDRILGLASLSMENASMGAGVYSKSQTKYLGFVDNQNKRGVETVGSSGNKVSIPGLKKENAEALKNLVLQKMKENPIEDGQSGL